MPKATLESLRSQLQALNQSFEEYALSLDCSAEFSEPVQELPPGKMSRATLWFVMFSQYEGFTANRRQYRLPDFRKHCAPLLAKHFCAEDLEPDSDNTPKWHGRFSYSHREVAAQHGYQSKGNGIYVTSGH